MSFYTDAVIELERLFSDINQRWFNNELDMPIISIMTSRKAYGWFYAESWEDKNNTDDNGSPIKINELNISPEFLTRTALEICTTLCHEACHLFAHQTGQEDTSNNNAYHNRVFKDIAEQHGLIVSKHSKASAGWAQTDPNPDFQEWFESIIPVNESLFDIYRNPPLKESKPTKKMVKYTCPVCDKAVRGDENIFVMCKECSKLMLTKEQLRAMEEDGATEEDFLTGEYFSEKGDNCDD